MHDTPPPVTTAAEIKRRAATGITITLPESGATVVVGRPSALELVAEGRIPDHLTSIVVKGAIDALETNPDGASEFVDAVDAVLCAAFRDPRMRREPADGEIAPSDLPFADRLFAYQVVARGEGAQDIARFRPQQGGDVAPVASVAGLPVSPVESGGA